eukprot:TCONS_00020195-protein
MPPIFPTKKMMLFWLLMLLNVIGTAQCQNTCNNGNEHSLMNISTVYTKENLIGSYDNLFHQIRKEFFIDQIEVPSTNNLFYFNITIETCRNESSTLKINCTNCVLKIINGINIDETTFRKNVLGKELVTVSFVISNQLNNNVIFDITLQENGTRLLKKNLSKIVCYPNDAGSFFTLTSEPATNLVYGDTISISINTSSYHNELLLVLPISNQEFNYTISSTTCKQVLTTKLKDINVFSLEVNNNNKCIVDIIILNVKPATTIYAHWYPVSNQTKCLSSNKNLLQLDSKPVQIYYNTSRETIDLLAGEAFFLTVNLEFPKTEVNALTINISFIGDELLDMNIASLAYINAVFENDHMTSVITNQSSNGIALVIPSYISSAPSNITIDLEMQIIDDAFQASGRSGAVSIQCLSSIKSFRVQSIGPILKPALTLEKKAEVFGEKRNYLRTELVLKHQTNSSDIAFNVGIYDGFPGMQLVSVHQSQEEVVTYTDSLINFKINAFGVQEESTFVYITKFSSLWEPSESRTYNNTELIWTSGQVNSPIYKKVNNGAICLHQHVKEEQNVVFNYGYLILAVVLGIFFGIVIAFIIIHLLKKLPQFRNYVLHTDEVDENEEENAKQSTRRTKSKLPDYYLLFDPQDTEEIVEKTWKEKLNEKFSNGRLNKKEDVEEDQKLLTNLLKEDHQSLLKEMDEKKDTLWTKLCFDLDLAVLSKFTILASIRQSASQHIMQYFIKVWSSVIQRKLKEI